MGLLVSTTENLSPLAGEKVMYRCVLVVGSAVNSRVMCPV